ncbi:MAG: methylmalonyl-CoA epimerase [Bacteroidaceae bacterium]|jgi:methylmalonyl-CoA/ethylmalonyl-CoA epimerase|nr:methylmalonyl-CoA epimerase [Bacteroidaceae bacterium]MBO5785291.1 methylmalonyl-CoA epimerase [Bacteroidaceae bacterium]MBO7172633.1 methylmalonyl-CoA epimerase [Bacteroidaceae bacterium]MBQ2012444.1 methylmalonyl-CoA epimerase [Bacteroidaceae bacterium]MBQ2043599.1 methylmalonyl-CoA epimerase [Bacteroidaceae bacterium]
MKISRIEHIGIAVQSIAEVLPYYKDVLGLEVYKEEVVEDQKVKTAFLQVGEVKLELLEPTCPESTIQKFLDNGGKGVHHVAFKVEDGVTEALAMCDEKGIRLIDKAPRNGADGLKIAFLHPKSTCGILTELCEE